MFKAALQRNARLGTAVRLSAARLAAPRAVRLPTFEQQRVGGSSVSSITSQLNATRTLSIRFYSSEAVAQATPAKENAVPSGRVTRFDDLEKLGVNPQLVSAITKGMGYTDMTEVQSLTINQAMRGTDLVAQAKTGTGKTLAFLVPVFQRMLQKDPEMAYRGSRRRPTIDDIKAIILSPTRELAEQIGVEAKKLARDTGIKVQTAVGGTHKREAMQRMRREGCDVLVATPGRLHDILSDPYSGVAAPNLGVLVLDEADRMLDVGFADAIRDIVGVLPRIQDVDRQTLLFSATIPKDVVHLAKSMVKEDDFEFVQTIRKDEAPTHEKVPQHIVTCVGFENQFPAVMEMMEKAKQATEADPSAPPFKAIVFFSNTATVQFAFDTFRNTSYFGRGGGFPMYSIHSKLSQAQRTRNADSFRHTQNGILFSSDVTARGMDFPGVSHVIQVGLPPDRDQYIHRVGRTGRAGASGEGWLLITSEEIREARSRLPGLPIKPNNTLQAASHDLTQGPPPAEIAKFFEESSHGYSRTRDYMFDEVYHALLGAKMGRSLQKEQMVDLLNNWGRYGLGLETMPTVSAFKARNMGLSRHGGLNIGEERRGPPSDDFFRDRRGGDRRGGDRRGGDRRGGNRQSSDPFLNKFSSGEFSDGGRGGRGDRGDRGDRGGRFGGRGGRGDRRGSEASF